MKTIALSIPWSNGAPLPIPTPEGLNIGTGDQPITLIALTSRVIEVIFYVAIFLVFIWSVIGIFQYILAGGNKEKLAKARARIQWAFLGFAFLLLSFAISAYIKSVFLQQ